MKSTNTDVIRVTKILEDEIVNELCFLANRIIMKIDKNVQEALIADKERKSIELIKNNDCLLGLLNKYKENLTE